jgi:hypothetical protein
MILARGEKGWKGIKSNVDGDCLRYPISCDLTYTSNRSVEGQQEACGTFDVYTNKCTLCCSIGDTEVLYPHNQYHVEVGPSGGATILLKCRDFLRLHGMQLGLKQSMDVWNSLLSSSSLRITCLDSQVRKEPQDIMGECKLLGLGM